MKFINFPIIVVLILFLTNFTGVSQEEQSLQNRTNENNLRFGVPQDIKNKLDDFFDAVVKKDYKNGLEKLLINSPVSRKDKDFTEILKQISKAVELYGQIKGYEIASSNIAGSSLYKVKIIGLHQKLPTR